MLLCYLFVLIININHMSIVIYIIIQISSLIGTKIIIFMRNILLYLNICQLVCLISEFETFVVIMSTV